MLASTGSTPNAYLYTGAQLDPNVGFYYLRARYYDPQRGRFFASDPEEGNIYEPMSLHRYLYANANPITFYDPSGRQIETIAALLVVLTGTNAIVGGITAGVTNLVLKGAPLGFKKASTFLTEVAVGVVAGGASTVPFFGPIVASAISVIKGLFITHYIAKQDITWNEVLSSVIIDGIIGSVAGVALQGLGDVGQAALAGGTQNVLRLVGLGVGLLTGANTSGLEELLKGGFIGGTSPPFWCRKHYTPHLSLAAQACK